MQTSLGECTSANKHLWDSGRRNHFWDKCTNPELHAKVKYKWIYTAGAHILRSHIQEEALTRVSRPKAINTVQRGTNAAHPSLALSCSSTLKHDNHTLSPCWKSFLTNPHYSLIRPPATFQTLSCKADLRLPPHLVAPGTKASTQTKKYLTAVVIHLAARFKSHPCTHSAKSCTIAPLTTLASA
eukprot:1158667-Pelagomonas_calceolata.AAC.4